MYSAWAHARGMAEPAGLPGAREDWHWAARGRSKVVPRDQAALAGKRLQITNVSLRVASGGNLVVGAFSREQRPWAADALRTKRLALVTLAVAVVVVTTIARTVGEVVLQDGVDDPDRVLDDRVAGGSDAEADEFEKAAIDDVPGGNAPP